MKPDEVRHFVKQKPFVPFRIYLSNGINHDVKHPEVATVTNSYVEIGVNASEGIPFHIIRMSLVHIVQIEELKK